MADKTPSTRSETMKVKRSPSGSIMMMGDSGIVGINTNGTAIVRHYDYTENCMLDNEQIEKALGLALTDFNNRISGPKTIQEWKYALIDMPMGISQSITAGAIPKLCKNAGAAK